MAAATERPLPLPTPGAPEREAVRAMFDRIAPRYDLANRVLSVGVDRRWRRACVASLDLPAGARVLDLCTGTADLLVEALGAEADRRGVGIDLSPEMLKRGAAKLRAQGMAPRAALAAGDACALPLAAASFDAALAAFGIRNVEDALRALRELARVLRPGAQLRILEFTVPRGALAWAYRLYFRHVLPRLGGLVSGDRGAYAYLPASVARFPRPAEFAALLAAAGFGRVRWRTLTFGVACLYEGERAA